MGYCITLDQGDYLETRGAHDWGRTKTRPTVFDTREEAEAFAKHAGSAFREVIGEWEVA